MTPTARARAWLAIDPDPETRAATEAMLATGDDAVLSEHFGAELRFGTAGMRGPLGPGPNRMNRAWVRRVCAGLAAYVRDRGGRTAVVGFDARHGSRVFADDAAAVIAGAGLQVYLHGDVCPTPALAFALRHLRCDVGVMITASHNPATDNGIKVYWRDGAQIVPPHDRGISDAIGAVGGVDIPSPDTLRSSGRIAPVPDGVRSAYIDAVLRLRVHRGGTLRIVYTAMHGVGRRLLSEVLDRAGHSDVHVVAEQAAPDPDFPTAPAPNPEEPGALELAITLAEKVGAALVLAHDPDADRLAVAVSTASGFRQLTGNQLGVLLADDLLTHGVAHGTPLVATTVVSTAMLARLAKHHGAAYAETLTGFKWIAARALAHEAAGGTFVLGFEEAIGYAPGLVVADKDGISTALLVADLAAHLAARGQSLLDRLEALYRRHGLHVTAQHSAVLPGSEGADRMRAILARLREEPPEHLGGVAVVRIRDLSVGEAHDLRTGAITPLDLPRNDVLAYELADGGRVLARPSGTEPKIKIYFEVCVPLGPGETLAAAQTRADGQIAALRRDMRARTGL